MNEAHSKLREIFRNQDIKLICVDADDTLWYDSRYFRQIEQLLVTCCEDDHIRGSRILGLLDEERKNHSPGEHGFAASVRELIRSFAWSDERIARVELELEKFLTHPVELLPRAKETLRLLQNYHRVLLTKGQEPEQRRKMSKSGLNEVFVSVVVLNKKGIKELTQVLREVGFAGKQTLVIGNSIQHDIIPAIENDASAIYLNHHENTHGRNGVLPSDAVEVETWEEIENALKFALAI